MPRLVIPSEYQEIALKVWADQQAQQADVEELEALLALPDPRDA